MNEQKKVIYVMKDNLDGYPPCISQIVMLCEMGIAVDVITEVCNVITAAVIENAGAKLHILGNLNPHKKILGRIAHWINFQRLTAKKIKELYSDGDVLWLGSATTAMVLKPFVKDKVFVLNVLELYDTWPLYKKKLGKIINHAHSVVACELNRARIMRQWYNLKELPFVMPNKPYYELDSEKTDGVEKLEESLKGKKYVLYQGVLDAERPLNTLAEALKRTKEKYTFVVVGACTVKSLEEKIISDLKSIYDDVVFGGYFPAPQHLYITENAHIGVAIYDTSSLNTMFCAPNKTFEYSKYNVPIIGSDIPGLQLTVEKNGAGICVDIDNPDEIAKAIDTISDNYAEYQKGSERLYNSVNNRKTIKEMLEKLNFIEK